LSNSIYGFIVGVSDYSAICGATDLPYCNNDILYFSKALRYGLCVDPHNMIILGQYKTVTKSDFLAGLRAFLAMVSSEDTLIFYYSGHSTILPQNGQHCFVLSDEIIPTQDIVDLFDQIPTKNRIVFIDSCMSGSYTLSNPKQIDPISWMDGLVARGCVVLSSCNKEEVSGFHPVAPLSLFTTFLCEALFSDYGIKEGYKSFETIKDWVLLRAKSWNEQNPNRKQTPIFRSNVGGTIMFKVRDSKGYVPNEYYADHNKYIIYSIEPVHNGIAKRYSAKVILKMPSTIQEVARIMKSIVTELETVDIYQSERIEKLWRGKNPNIVFAYFGYDETDIVNANYAYRAIWADDKQDKSIWYKLTKDSCLVDNIFITTVSYYDMMHKFNLEHTDSAEELIGKTKEIISKLISSAELVIREFTEYQNEVIDEEEMVRRIQPLIREIDRLYFVEADLGIPPVELHEWSQKCSNIAATIHDFSLFYSERFLKDRTPENRIQCMKMTIKRYHDDLYSLSVADKEQLISLPKS